VIARGTPDTRSPPLLESLEAEGNIVAMTGDGVKTPLL